MFFNMEGLKMRHDENYEVLQGQYNNNNRNKFVVADGETTISTSTSTSTTSMTHEQTIQEDANSESEDHNDDLDADANFGYEFEYQKQLNQHNHQLQQQQQHNHNHNHEYQKQRQQQQQQQLAQQLYSSSVVRNNYYYYYCNKKKNQQGGNIIRTQIQTQLLQAQLQLQQNLQVNIGSDSDVDIYINPIVVDKMVANQLNSLSMIHRERALEEIHGIGCRKSRCTGTCITDDNLDNNSINNSSSTSFVDNDDDYIRKLEEDDALMKLQEELDKIYLSTSTSNSTNTTAGSTINNNVLRQFPAYHYARTHNSALLKDRSFCLSFIKTEGYTNPKKAALRLMRHLDYIKDAYNTTSVLFRPIQLSDLDNTIKADNTAAVEDDDETAGRDNNGTMMLIESNISNTKKKKKKKTIKNNKNKVKYTAKRLLMEEGFLQIMPVRDTSGRRVVVHIREPPQIYPVSSKQGIAYYMDQSIANSKDGAILVFFLHNVLLTMNNKDELQNIHQLFKTMRTKYSAIHLCCPNRPFYETVKATYTLLVGKENRTRLRFHSGSYQECKYSLKSFGIPVERFPSNLFVSKSDNVIHKENHNHRKWISMQQTLENEIQNEVNKDMMKLKSSGSSDGSNNNNNNNNNSVDDDDDDDDDSSSMPISSAIISYSSTSTIEMNAYYKIRSKYIECAYHEDCLFGKGRPAMKHPGNVAMRRLLEEKFDRYNNTPSIQEQKKMIQQQQQQQLQSPPISVNMQMKTKIALEIVHEIKRGSGRFLKEAENTTTTTGATATTSCSGLLINVNDQAALQKIKIAFRDLKRRKVKEGSLLLASSSSSPTVTPFIKSQSQSQSYFNNTDGNCDVNNIRSSNNTITSSSSPKKKRALSPTCITHWN